MVVQSQQVTKDQLLKLFYQANTALNNNQTETAIEFYSKILRLSPSLPEPYLQLGDIYSTMTADAASLEKACKYYANYLELNKDAKDADLLRNKISELTAKVKQLNNLSQLVTVNEQLELAENPSLVVNLDSHTEELAELPIENVKKEEAKLELNDSIEIIPDTIPTLLPSNESGINLMPDSLIGKWVSAEIGIDGREMWIFEIKKNDNQYFILLNDSSYVFRSESNLKDVFANGMQILVEANELVVNYKKEQEKSKEKIGNVTKDGFGEVLGGLLNVDLKFDLFME
jgi:tetratricopeptide (TPR) repeat protein